MDLHFNFDLKLKQFYGNIKRCSSFLIFHVLAMPAASRHVFLTKTAVDYFCLQWRVTCRNLSKSRIKMASTFLFVKIKWLEVCEKWSGTSEDSILDIFSVSTIYYDELIIIVMYTQCWNLDSRVISEIIELRAGGKIGHISNKS